VSTKNVSPFGPAIWPAIGKIYKYMNVLFYYIEIYRVTKKSVICGVWCKIVLFLCNSPVWFFLIFFENLYFFWCSNGPKENPRIFFSLKIKSSEKQKCTFILFLSKSQILLRLNHRITNKLAKL